MADPPVLSAVDARGVATLTLNRPEVNNAYNGEMIDALIAAGEALSGDRRVRVVVLRGAGRHFQAGADLKWLQECSRLDEAGNLEVSRRTASAVRGLGELPVPTVALIHGACYGGGVGIAAACDVVIASAEASFAITEARWGLMAGIIIPQLNAALGARQVRRYALTCERFDAATAKALGLVHEVCPSGGLEQAAAPIIDALLRAAPGSLAETKRTVLAEAGLLLEEARFAALVRDHAAKRRSTEAAEGLASFVEKRPPAWYPEPS